ncbi:uncharacterized protein MELLADRAFT_108889 [Melampsora larici-populina 98AG31]|uniref:Uncharacterized protein n=1 Tax=Melampsora larici-populina (strain 98AG31 / pathotype 3-4-7) TaxID=747676 RepID=F4RUM4_MELLP|nr:uncharacterized protein MELLADRAFT_108889 [Melampsora larici-populina 98AG31]EGG03957.1 hypothetical protein MELLADRAFT_108889 [Melampsora larici-populina 98AG31]
MSCSNAFPTAFLNSVYGPHVSRKRTIAHIDNSVCVSDLAPVAHIKRARIVRPQPQGFIYTSTGVTTSSQDFAYVGSGSEVIRRSYPNMNFLITNHQETTRHEDFEAFKLQLALELLMGPAPPSLMSGNQTSPSTSTSSLPSSLNPSPTVPFRQTTSYPHRPPNPAIERRRPMPLSFVNVPNEDPHQFERSQMIEAKGKEGVSQSSSLKSVEEKDEDKKILNDLQNLFPSYQYPPPLSW